MCYGRETRTLGIPRSACGAMCYRSGRIRVHVGSARGSRLGKEEKEEKLKERERKREEIAAAECELAAQKIVAENNVSI